MSDDEKIRRVIQGLAWIAFAAAGLSAGNDTVTNISLRADTMLKEFERRFNLIEILKDRK